MRADIRKTLLPGHLGRPRAAGLVSNIKGATVLADKAYDCDAFHDHIHAYGGVANIPGRKSRKEEVFLSGRDRADRHLIENFFARIKRHRRINLRHDK